MKIWEILGTLGFCACMILVAGLFAFALFNTRRTPKAVNVAPRVPSILLFIALLVGVWFWLCYGIGLLAWGFWIGDNEHWFYHVWPYLSAIIAFALAAHVLLRTWRGQTTAIYRRVYWISAIALLLVIGAIQGHEVISRIEGTTPRAAAEAILGRGILASKEKLEEENRELDASGEVRCVTYLLRGDTEPIARVTVCRYGPFWWTHAASERFEPSAKVLERAKEARLTDSRRDGRAALILQIIVRNYPGTPAAAEAQAILAEMGIKDADH